MKLNCIIIEDEPLALERVKGFIDKTPFLNLLDAFDNALDGLNYLRNNSIDLLFLDINMDEISGIELLEQMKPDFAVIITTAYDQYALKGYELNVTDYLLKPFNFQRFLSAVNKVQTKNTEKQRFFIKGDKKYHQIASEDILFIEAYGNYTKVFFLIVIHAIIYASTFLKNESILS